MTLGSIIVVDWRDALPGSGVFQNGLSYVLAVPLTADAALRITEAFLEIAPTEENRCSKRCFALSWNLQTVPKRRIRATEAEVTAAQLQAIRDQIARLVER